MLHTKNKIMPTNNLDLDYIRENIDSFDVKTIRDLIFKLEKSVKQDRKSISTTQKEIKNLESFMEINKSKIEDITKKEVIDI